MITFKRLSDIPFCFNLRRRPSCQTLSNTFDISRKTLRRHHLVSRGHHLVTDKYREWYIIVDWWMSLLVWTLIDYERLVHFLWKTRTFCNRLVVLVSCHKQAATRSDDSFLLTVYYFFNELGQHPLFSIRWEIFQYSMHDLKPVRRKRNPVYDKSYQNMPKVFKIQNE